MNGNGIQYDYVLTKRLASPEGPLIIGDPNQETIIYGFDQQTLNLVAADPITITNLPGNQTQIGLDIGNGLIIDGTGALAVNPSAAQTGSSFTATNGAVSTALFPGQIINNGSPVFTFSGGAVQLPSLSSGGIVTAAPFSGQLSATAFPAAGTILGSNGAGIVPIIAGTGVTITPSGTGYQINAPGGGAGVASIASSTLTVLPTNPGTGAVTIDIPAGGLTIGGTTYGANITTTNPTFSLPLTSQVIAGNMLVDSINFTGASGLSLSNAGFVQTAPARFTLPTLSAIPNIAPTAQPGIVLAAPGADGTLSSTPLPAAGQLLQSNGTGVAGLTIGPNFTTTGGTLAIAPGVIPPTLTAGNNLQIVGNVISTTPDITVTGTLNASRLADNSEGTTLTNNVLSPPIPIPGASLFYRDTVSNVNNGGVTTSPLYTINLPNAGSAYSVTVLVKATFLNNITAQYGYVERKYLVCGNFINAPVASALVNISREGVSVTAPGAGQTIGDVFDLVATLTGPLFTIASNIAPSTTTVTSAIIETTIIG